MVREAYSLLRQSIIHVEQDDINFEEDDEQPNGLTNGHGAPNGTRSTEEDESMDAADAAALDAAESSYRTTNTSAPNGDAPDSSVTKRKMRITCEYCYMRDKVTLY